MSGTTESPSVGDGEGEPDPLVVIAELRAGQSSIGALRSSLRGMVEPSRAEADCLAYDLHQDSEDAATFVIYERWTSEAALEAHFRTTHFRTLSARLEGLLDRPMIVRRLGPAIA